MDTYIDLRLNMVAHQIEARGVRNTAVLEALRKVPRHRFVSDEFIDLAYADCALPASNGQTISQPFIVGIMTEMLELKPGDRVLEIGTGTGYQSAILAELDVEVFTVERIPALYESAKIRLTEMGYEGITCILGNGYDGFAQSAPYDAIIVTAAAPFIPKALIDQLAPGGRMVIPVGTAVQELVLVTKASDGHVTEMPLLGVRFVPLVGQ